MLAKFRWSKRPPKSFNTTSDKRSDIIKVFFETLKKYNIKYKIFLFFFIILTLASSLAFFAVELVTGNMAQAAYEFDISLMLNLFLLLSGVTLIRAVSSALTVLYLNRFEVKVSYTFRSYFAKYFLMLPFNKFEKVNSGKSLSILSNDLPSVAKFVSSGGLQMASDFIFFLISMILMFFVNWIYSLVFFVIFPFLIMLQASLAKPMEKHSANMLKEKARFNALLNDSLHNLDVVKAYSLEEILENRFLEINNKLMKQFKKNLNTITIMFISAMVVSVGPLLALTSFSAISVINTSMELALFFVFISLASSSSQWLLDFSHSIAWRKMEKASAIRMNEALIEKVERIEDLGEIEKLNIKDPLISFADVSFKYNEEESNLVLNGISFDIKRGEKVAIVGPSGSGKSTILKLLLKLYSQNSGKIKLFDQNLEFINHETVRNYFSYIPQNSFLFPETIAENITLKLYDSLNQIEKERLEQVTKDAGIFKFISSLPYKFNSLITEAADNISGGQRQRIALARAFYKNAPIILLDEATSALDSQTESEIFEVLKNISKDKTLIMVAHRQSAIDFCDHIIRIDGGTTR